MVIKERYKRLKTPHKAEGFMLLEVVALLGFVVCMSVAVSTLHSLIMTSYRDTVTRMQALSYAENILASTLTGVAYQEQSTTQAASININENQSFQKNALFKSTLRQTRGVPFLPTQKPFSVVTVTVTWRERGQEESVVLTRAVPDKGEFA